MDLLAIMKDRMNKKLTNTGSIANYDSAHEPAEGHDELEADASDISFDMGCHFTVHDALHKIVSGPVRNASSRARGNIYIIHDNTRKRLPEAAQQMRPRSSLDPSWSPEVQALVDWFLTLSPPEESFYLGDHSHIVDPVKFFQSLRQEIHTGPGGPRARMGTLQGDLYKLREYFSDERKA